MLQPIRWKYGIHDETGRWRCPIAIYQDFDTSVIWLRWIDETVEREARKRNDNSDRIPICLPIIPGGVYETTFNFDTFLNLDHSNVQVIDKWGDGNTSDVGDDRESVLRWLEWRASQKSRYGVADNVDQVLDYYAAEITDPNHKYVIGVTEIRREDEPKRDGWRWHKWGPYIGIRTPQHEYIRDEENIDAVWCFHLYEVEVVDE